MEHEVLIECVSICEGLGFTCGDLVFDGFHVNKGVREVAELEEMARTITRDIRKRRVWKHFKIRCKSFEMPEHAPETGISMQDRIENARPYRAMLNSKEERVRAEIWLDEVVAKLGGATGGAVASARTLIAAQQADAPEVVGMTDSDDGEHRASDLTEYLGQGLDETELDKGLHEPVGERGMATAQVFVAEINGSGKKSEVVAETGNERGSTEEVSRRRMVSVIGNRWMHETVMAGVQDAYAEEQRVRLNASDGRVGSDEPWIVPPDWSRQIGVDDPSMEGEVWNMKLVTSKLKALARTRRAETQWFVCVVRVREHQYVTCEVQLPAGPKAGMVSSSTAS
jgi:hypothetical protein